VEDGPLFWAAFKSKYFLLALMAGDDWEAGRFLGGIFARLPLDAQDGEEPRVSVTVAQSLLPDDSFAYRVYLGPQDFTRLTAIGGDLEDVNPVGWRWLRPVIQPFAAIITTILIYLHNQLGWGYGWVLILFGVMMRVVLFPLNQKAMRAQLRNTAVAPLVKEIQAKYKNDPDRQQKEMMRLYREHGFNPLAGCVPMLIPLPVLITLFFVFQNTIELRGVSFLWLPDLSAPDPLYLLPVFLGVSMFLLQWVSMRSMEQVNPQMKMMLWFMPIFMVFIFFRLASGLNLYYATANIATLPQQYWIAKERQKARTKPS
jgi:YidC/Oxa1 family membrane protein insertase